MLRPLGEKDIRIRLSSDQPLPKPARTLSDMPGIFSYDI
jgi:hypothetical protein